LEPGTRFQLSALPSLTLKGFNNTEADFMTEIWQFFRGTSIYVLSIGYIASFDVAEFNILLSQRISPLVVLHYLLLSPDMNADYEAQQSIINTAKSLCIGVRVETEKSMRMQIVNNLITEGILSTRFCRMSGDDCECTRQKGGVD